MPFSRPGGPPGMPPGLGMPPPGKIILEFAMDCRIHSPLHIDSTSCPLLEGFNPGGGQFMGGPPPGFGSQGPPPGFPSGQQFPGPPGYVLIFLFQAGRN